MHLDTAIINLPLAKRGAIDAQLDAYKAQQAREAKVSRKAAAATTKELRAAAKAAVAGLTADQLDAIAARIGSTRVQARKELHSLAYWEPSTAMRIVGAA